MQIYKGNDFKSLFYFFRIFNRFKDGKMGQSEDLKRTLLEIFLEIVYVVLEFLFVFCEGGVVGVVFFFRYREGYFSGDI